MTRPGFTVTESIRSKITAKVVRTSGALPSSVRSHSELQEFDFDSDFSPRRHDYRVDVAVGCGDSYVYDIVESDGIKLPTKRRAYRCDADGRLMADELMVSIDVSDVV